MDFHKKLSDGHICPSESFFYEVLGEVLAFGRFTETSGKGFPFVSG